MSKISAGLLMFRREAGELQVLLAHPGGPFFRQKDAGAWTIPKGEVHEAEGAQQAALREFAEETGVVPLGDLIALTPIKQKGGKVVHAWAVEGTCDPSRLTSNTFTIEWPPKSGRQQDFPEIDRAEFFNLATAKQKINPAQVSLLEELVTKIEPTPQA
ncbi:NUDIX domain-containing protein [Bremerella cremea]|uniref:NUDIX domain-containing protein n=1 Tax=Bremerella cremea TaxID=1031537 RepID=A0A368KT14_9BACT|nr:NUDIX domain-containing protein [Bremerella cremea]